MTMLPMRKAILWCVLVVVCVSGVADAHSATFATRVRRTTFTTEGNIVTSISGVVRSAKDRCERGRTVVAYYGNSRYGSTTSDANGRWTIVDEGFINRTYKYTVYPKRIGRVPHRHICGTARASEVLGAEEEEE